MNRQNHYSRKLLKPSDLFLAAAFFIAALLGREGMSLRLFIALWAARLCALSTATALRPAFARQPSMRYVQGSALLAGLLQIPGAAVAALILRQLPLYRELSPMPFVVGGALLNIEHVFYEYLYAVGDEESAAGCRGITSLLTLAGLLLCAPPSQSAAPAYFAKGWLLITSGLSALAGLALALGLGGAPKPRWSSDLLSCSPLSMLQTALYPALALAGLYLVFPVFAGPVPLFAGLMVYDVWRTPFRRAAVESEPMNRALLLLCAIAAFGGMLCGFALSSSVALTAAACCGAVILAALCAFAMYGNVRRKTD